MISIDVNKLIRFLLLLFTSFSCTNILFKVLGIPVFLIFLVILILGCCIKFRTTNDIKIGYAFIFIVFWVGYGIILCLISNNEIAWRALLYLLVNSLGFYIVYNLCVKDSSCIKYCYYGYLLGLLVNLVVGLLEINYNFHLVPLTEDYERMFINRPLGFFANTNDLAVVLVTLFCAMFMHLVSREWSMSKRIETSCLVLLSFIGAYLLVFINSTTCFIIVCLFLMLLLFCFVFFKVKHRNMFLCLVCFIVVCSSLCGVIMFEELTQKFFPNVDFHTISGRSDLWAFAIDATIFSYGFGIGPGQNTVIGYGNVHNFLLEIISEYGLVVFCFVLIFYVKYIKKSLERNNIVSYIFFSFLMIFFLLSVASSSISKLYPVWSALGFMAALLKRSKEVSSK